MKIKKIHIVALCLVIVSSFLFTGCLTFLLVSSLRNKADEKNFYKTFAESVKGTPSDSVLVYGNFNNKAVGAHFVQADTTKTPGYLPAIMSSGIIVSRPVEPGTRYKILWGTETGGRVSQTVYFGLSGQSPLDFSVPNKPGLFYYGDYKVSFMFGNISKMTFDSKKAAAAELKILKEVQKLYAKTEWESLIKTRMEELQNAK